MSRDDLLSDLRDEVAARPVAPSVPPPQAPATHVSRGTRTPALDVSLTPLQWSLLRLGPASHGRGLSLRVGPLQVSLGVR
jgi:hypothetical protein